MNCVLKLLHKQLRDYRGCLVGVCVCVGVKKAMRQSRLALLSL